ncbi:MAG: hypothetical protein ABIN58_12405 [candidate division WOR-3 bacterium]
MNFIKERYTQFCLLSFAITSGFGLLLTLWPRLVDRLIGLRGPLVYNTFFARVLGLVLLALGFAYVLALIYEEAKNPLLLVATMEKCLAVLYVLVALFKGQIGGMALGMLIVDTAIALFGIMAIRMPEEYDAG